MTWNPVQGTAAGESVYPGTDSGASLCSQSPVRRDRRFTRVSCNPAFFPEAALDGSAVPGCERAHIGGDSDHRTNRCRCGCRSVDGGDGNGELTACQDVQPDLPACKGGMVTSKFSSRARAGLPGVSPGKGLSPPAPSCDREHPARHSRSDAGLSHDSPHRGEG